MKYKKQHKVKDEREWTCDKENQMLYNYDIWSNIHYGYVGLAVGFNEWELKNAAGAAQISDNTVPKDKDKGEFDRLDFLASFDDPKDQEAIKIGFRLFDDYKLNIKSEHLLKELRNNATKLNTKKHEVKDEI